MSTYYELIAKYNLKQKQFDYELKRSQKKNMSIEEWLEYKYSANKDDIDFFTRLNNNYDVDELVSDKAKGHLVELNKFVDDIYDSKFGRIVDMTQGLNSSYTINTALKDFFTIQKSIKDARFFWAIFGTFYMSVDVSRRYYDEFCSLFTEERMAVNVEDRIKYSTLLEAKDNSDELLHIFKDFKDDDDITIYRGFMVRDGKKIMDKENEKQLEGSGLSYSLSKEIGKAFCKRFSKFWTLFNGIEKNKELLEGFGGSMVEVLKNNRRECERLNVDFERINFDSNYEQIARDTFCLKKLAFELKSTRSLGFKQQQKDDFIESISNMDFESNSINLERFKTDKVYRDYQIKNNIILKAFINSKDDLTKHMEKMYETKIDEESKSYWGEYTIKKKDIITGLNLNNQLEIIAKIEDVKMKRYEIMYVDEKELTATRIGIHARSQFDSLT